MDKVDYLIPFHIRYPDGYPFDDLCKPIYCGINRETQRVEHIHHHHYERNILDDPYVCTAEGW